jgi:hypothetical protein
MTLPDKLKSTTLHVSAADVARLREACDEASKPYLEARAAAGSPEGVAFAERLAAMTPEAAAEELRECLPTEQVRDDDEVAEALAFLLNDWLIDVRCSFVDKCCALALGATIIERSLPPERPVGFVTSPTPESGKTTLMKMLIGAITGTEAVAFAWSPNEEERRKAVLAYLDAGLSHVLIDNIPDGATIACQHFERASTIQFYADRKKSALRRYSRRRKRSRKRAQA